MRMDYRTEIQRTARHLPSATWWERLDGTYQPKKVTRLVLPCQGKCLSPGEDTNRSGGANMAATGEVRKTPRAHTNSRSDCGSRGVTSGPVSARNTLISLRIPNRPGR